MSAALEESLSFIASQKHRPGSIAVFPDNLTSDFRLSSIVIEKNLFLALLLALCLGDHAFPRTIIFLSKKEEFNFPACL